MKKLMSIFIVLMMLLSLTSCAGKTQGEQQLPTPDSPGASDTDREPGNGGITEDLLDPDSSFSYEETEIPEEPTEEELKDLIAKYMEFESYMKYTTPAVDYGSHMSDDPGSNEYYMVKITDPRMATPEAWEDYFASIFAVGKSSGTPSTETEWIKERITEHNGAMYALDAGIGWPYTDQYVVTGIVPETDSERISVWFAREMEPPFRSQESEAEYWVVRLHITYTEDGWRVVLLTEYQIVEAGWPDYMPKENLDSYHPFS